MAALANGAVATTKACSEKQAPVTVADGDSTSLYHRSWQSLVLFSRANAMARRLRLVPQPRGGLMASSVLWHGSQTEALELLQALSRNCSCVVTAEGVRLSTCAPHEMLSADQRAIDGLLFARRIASRLRSEEFHPAQSEVAFTS
jgi:hypothetical protein